MMPAAWSRSGRTRVTSVLLPLALPFFLSTSHAAADEACAADIRRRGGAMGTTERARGGGLDRQRGRTQPREYEYEYDYDDDDYDDDDEGGGNERGDGARGDDNLFYAWSSDRGMPLIGALFPDAGRLRSAWEVHPLLSRVSFVVDGSHRSRRRGGGGEGEANDGASTIPTIVHDRTLLSQLDSNLDLDLDRDRSDRRTDTGDGNDRDPLLSLFAVDDIPLVLSQEGMKHHSDYKLVKKVVLPSSHPDAPGEEYNGSPPEPHFTVQEISRHFHYGAFSLVINKMQHRWWPIARMGRKIEDELGVTCVGANLYLTPMVTDTGSNNAQDGNVRQGFEAHWDWMDGKCSNE
jgi:hypothetical protein